MPRNLDRIMPGPRIAGPTTLLMASLLAIGAWMLVSDSLSPTFAGGKGGGQTPPDEGAPLTSTEFMRPLVFSPFELDRDTAFWQFVNTSTGEVALSIELGFGQADEALLPLQMTYNSGGLGLLANPQTASLFSDLGAPWVLPYCDRLVDLSAGGPVIEFIHLSSTGLATPLDETATGELVPSSRPRVPLGTFQQLSATVFEEYLDDGTVRTYTQMQPTVDEWVLTRSARPDGSSTVVRWTDGTINAVVTAAGTTFYQRTDGVLNSISLPDGSLVSFSYANGQLSAIVDGVGHLYTLAYDVDSVLGARLAVVETQGVDILDIQYEDDQPERAQTIILPDGTHTLSYDGVAGVTSVLENDQNIVAFAYDAMARTRTVSSQGLQTLRSYNADGLVDFLRLPDGSTFTYSYDDQGRVEFVRNDFDVIATIDYDATGSISRIHSPSGTSLDLDGDVILGELSTPDIVIINRALTMGVDELVESTADLTLEDDMIQARVDNRVFYPRTMLAERIGVAIADGTTSFQFLTHPSAMASIRPPMKANEYFGTSDMVGIVQIPPEPLPGTSAWNSNPRYQVNCWWIMSEQVGQNHDIDCMICDDDGETQDQVEICSGGGGGIGEVPPPPDCPLCQSHCNISSSTFVYVGEQTFADATFTPSCTGSPSFLSSSSAGGFPISQVINPVAGTASATFCWTSAGIGAVRFESPVSRPECDSHVSASCGSVSVRNCEVQVHGPSELCANTSGSYTAMGIPAIVSPAGLGQWVVDGETIDNTGETLWQAFSTEGPHMIQRTGVNPIACGPAEVHCIAIPLHIAVYRPPVIGQQPQDTTVGVNQDATFWVALDMAYVDFQWRLNGEVLVGETEHQLTLENVTLQQDQATVDVLVYNYCGFTVSEAATLYVVNND